MYFAVSISLSSPNALNGCSSWLIGTPSNIQKNKYILKALIAEKFVHCHCISSKNKAVLQLLFIAFYLRADGVFIWKMSAFLKQ